MKSRNKEVNIFNMSLLDILCGALGAFCFMMLSLFPDHAKVKDLQAQVQELRKERQQQCAAAHRAGARAGGRRSRAAGGRSATKPAPNRRSRTSWSSWDAPADVDLWIVGGSGRTVRAKEGPGAARQAAPVPLGTRPRDPATSIVWFTDVAYSGSVYRLFATLQAPQRLDRCLCRRTATIVARIRVGARAFDRWSSSTLAPCSWTKRAPLSSSVGSQFERRDFTLSPRAAPSGTR